MANSYFAIFSYHFCYRIFIPFSFHFESSNPSRLFPEMLIFCIYYI